MILHFFAAGCSVGTLPDGVEIRESLNVSHCIQMLEESLKNMAKQQIEHQKHYWEQLDNFRLEVRDELNQIKTPPGVDKEPAGDDFHQARSNPVYTARGHSLLSVSTSNDISPFYITCT